MEYLLAMKWLAITVIDLVYKIIASKLFYSQGLVYQMSTFPTGPSNMIDGCTIIVYGIDPGR